MDSVDFLDDFQFGQFDRARLSVACLDGSSIAIELRNLDTLRESCPLLALAFEDGPSGPRHCIENTTKEAAIALLRYAYCLDYIPAPFRGYTMSLLLHLHVHQLASNYDICGLKKQAYVQVLLACESAMEYTTPPVDLCRAIRFAYEHRSDCKTLLGPILSYCVASIDDHKLSEMPDFRELAYGLQSFHQDLCETNMQRGFLDAGASAIVKLPIKPGDQSSALASCARSNNDRVMPLRTDGVGSASPELHFAGFAFRPKPRPLETFHEVPLADNDWAHESYADVPLEGREHQIRAFRDAFTVATLKEAGYTVVHRNAQPVQELLSDSWLPDSEPGWVAVNGMTLTRRNSRECLMDAPTKLPEEHALVNEDDELNDGWTLL